MEPIPETVQAVEELEPFADDDDDLLEQLRVMGERVRAIVPDCVGLSVASIENGVTLTLVASDEEIAALDGVQYLAGGPCVDAVEADHGVATTREALFDEEAWRLFAQASAAAAVRSTLTLPIVHDGRTVGSVNLYGGTESSFAGHHVELAAIFRAWAPGAVTNADLSFRTRALAEEAPEILRLDARVEAATGILAAAQGIDVDTARTRLHESAQRAGITVAQLAEAIVNLRRV